MQLDVQRAARNASTAGTKLFAILAVLSISTFACGDEIRWHRSASAAAKVAEQTGKPILVYVRSATCVYCDKLKQDVWNNAAAARQVTQDFVPLKLTREENAEAIKSLGIKGYPAMFVFTPTRKYIGRIDGYIGPEQFVSAMAVAKTAQSKTELVQRLR